MDNIKLSVFTPTHNPVYIDELYETLLEQNYYNWEWIIITNGENTINIHKELTSKFKKDNRIKIYKHTIPKDKYDSEKSFDSNIGELKKQACSYATGDYLVEVDHDDLLNINAFEEIIDCIKKENPDFIFSDFCEFYSDWSCRYYNEENGWNRYEFIYKNKALIAMSAIEVSPRSLYQIFYAPNHIRIWKKDFYVKIGGHDETLKVCDDHDLVCRTYLNNGKMVKIPKPLYLYRLQDNNDNSYLKYNQEIQIKQQEIGNKYFYQMVDKWCNDNGLLKIDLGGAFNKPEGYLSVDLLDIADIKCDVTKGIPLADNSVGIVRAYDFLEHIPRETYYLEKKDDTDEVKLMKTNAFINLMNEIYRVLAPDGWLLSATPTANSKACWQDPTHVNPINTNTFWYFTNRSYSQYVPEIKCRFQDTRIWEHTIDNKNDLRYTCADLLCLKDNKVSGLVKI